MLAFYLSMVEDPDDQIAFETLYIRYRKQMFYLARALLSENAAAEDAVHDVFVTVASKHMATIKKIENETDIRSYLLKATKNTCLNYIQKRDKVRIPLDAAVEAVSVIKGNQMTDEAFWEHIHNCIEAECIVAAIKSLPAIYKDVLYYHFVVGFTAQEIAKATGEKLSTIKKRLVRGKAMLLQTQNPIEERNDYDKSRI